MDGPQRKVTGTPALTGAVPVQAASGVEVSATPTVSAAVPAPDWSLLPPLQKLLDAGVRGAQRFAEHAQQVVDPTPLQRVESLQRALRREHTETLEYEPRFSGGSADDAARTATPYIDTLHWDLLTAEDDTARQRAEQALATYERYMEITNAYDARVQALAGTTAPMVSEGLVTWQGAYADEASPSWRRDDDVKLPDGTTAPRYTREFPPTDALLPATHLNSQPLQRAYTRLSPEARTQWDAVFAALNAPRGTWQELFVGGADGNRHIVYDPKTGTAQESHETPAVAIAKLAAVRAALLPTLDTMLAAARQEVAHGPAALASGAIPPDQQLARDVRRLGGALRNEGELLDLMEQNFSDTASVFLPEYARLQRQIGPMRALQQAGYGAHAAAAGALRAGRTDDARRFLRRAHAHFEQLYHSPSRTAAVAIFERRSEHAERCRTIVGLSATIASMGLASMAEAGVMTIAAASARLAPSAAALGHVAQATAFTAAHAAANAAILHDPLPDAGTFAVESILFGRMLKRVHEVGQQTAQFAKHTQLGPFTSKLLGFATEAGFFAGVWSPAESVMREGLLTGKWDPKPAAAQYTSASALHHIANLLALKVGGALVKPISEPLQQRAAQRVHQALAARADHPVPTPVGEHIVQGARRAVRAFEDWLAPRDADGMVTSQVMPGLLMIWPFGWRTRIEAPADKPGAGGGGGKTAVRSEVPSPGPRPVIKARVEAEARDAAQKHLEAQWRAAKTPEAIEALLQGLPAEHPVFATVKATPMADAVRALADGTLTEAALRELPMTPIDVQGAFLRAMRQRVTVAEKLGADVDQGIHLALTRLTVDLSARFPDTWEERPEIREPMLEDRYPKWKMGECFLRDLETRFAATTAQLVDLKTTLDALPGNLPPSRQLEQIADVARLLDATGSPELKKLAERLRVLDQGTVVLPEQLGSLLDLKNTYFVVPGLAPVLFRFAKAVAESIPDFPQYPPGGSIETKLEQYRVQRGAAEKQLQPKISLQDVPPKSAGAGTRAVRVPRSPVEADSTASMLTAFLPARSNARSEADAARGRAPSPHHPVKADHAAIFQVDGSAQAGNRLLDIMRAAGENESLPANYALVVRDGSRLELWVASKDHVAIEPVPGTAHREDHPVMVYGEAGVKHAQIAAVADPSQGAALLAGEIGGRIRDGKIVDITFNTDSGEFGKMSHHHDLAARLDRMRDLVASLLAISPNRVQFVARPE